MESPAGRRTPDKEVIVIGDIEMGAGNLTDDFISDEALSKLIHTLARRKHPIDLVLNGDTFDFLKCPSQLRPETKYPRHISVDVSLAKLALIYKAHERVFNSLKSFASSPGKMIYFILGNHDQDLVYKEVQEELRKYLGDSRNVIFPGLVYRKHKVYVEHGQQYDILFRVNFEKIFLSHKGITILNFPFVAFGLLGKFMRLKEENPFLERIFPRPKMLSHHRVIARKINRYTLGYFLKSLMYYPFRFYSDPTYSWPRNLILEFFRQMKRARFDVDDIISIFKRQRKKRDKVYVLGHIHEKRLVRHRKKVIIHPGSWRDEYNFDSNTRELVPRRKRYVQIRIFEGNPEYRLVDYYIKRSIFYFDDVVKDELKYIRLSAKEENFTLQD